MPSRRNLETKGPLTEAKLNGFSQIKEPGYLPSYNGP